MRLIGPILSSGITQSSKVLPSLSTVRIKYTKNGRAFHVVQPTTTTGNFFLKIEELSLNIKRYELMKLIKINREHACRRFLCIILMLLQCAFGS